MKKWNINYVFRRIADLFHLSGKMKEQTSLDLYIHAYIRDAATMQRTTIHGKYYAASTIKTLRSFQRLWDDFQKERTSRADFKDIDMSFYHGFISFFQSKGHSVNTVGKTSPILTSARKRQAKRYIKADKVAFIEKVMNKYSYFKSIADYADMLYAPAPERGQSAIVFVLGMDPATYQLDAESLAFVYYEPKEAVDLSADLILKDDEGYAASKPTYTFTKVSENSTYAKYSCAVEVPEGCMAWVGMAKPEDVENAEVTAAQMVNKLAAGSYQSKYFVGTGTQDFNYVYPTYNFYIAWIDAAGKYHEAEAVPVSSLAE